MANYNIDLSALNGLAPRHEGQFSSSVPQPHLVSLSTENQYADGAVNPFRKLGFLSPSNDTLTLCTGTASIGGGIGIVVTQPDPVNNRIYLMDTGATITLHTLGTFSTSVLVGGTATLDTGTGATDMEEYTINGQRRLFYSYRKSAGGDIGTFDYGSTYATAWLSTTVAGTSYLGSTNYHKLQVADNGQMYVLDGSNVHRIDGTAATGGTNGTFYGNALSFPPIYQLFDSIDHRGLLWITVERSSRALYGEGTLDNAPISAGVYMWNRVSSIADGKDFVSISGIKAIRHIFTLDNVPHCITLSTANRTQVRKYNGVGFEVVEETSFENMPWWRDSLAPMQNGVLWLGFRSGKLMYYGKTPSQAKYGLYCLANLKNTYPLYHRSQALVVVGKSADETTLDTEYIYLSYRQNEGTNQFGLWYSFETVDRASANLNCGRGDFKGMVTKLPKLSHFKSATVYYPPTTSGSSANLDVAFYFNHSSSAWGTATLTSDDGARSWALVPVNEPNVNSFQLGLNWRTDVPLSNAITPSSIDIEYEPTTKKK